MEPVCKPSPGSPRIRCGVTMQSPVLVQSASSEQKVDKRALLISPAYLNHPRAKVPRALAVTAKDAERTKDVLIRQLGFENIDITMLVEVACENPDPAMIPTKENMHRELQKFAASFKENGIYFLGYAGHGVQDDAEDDLEEEDGQNEALAPTDAVDEDGIFLPENFIMDDLLKMIIVDKIQPLKGARLLALFDCCHSATILDLPHHRCNRVLHSVANHWRRLRRYVLERQECLAPFKKWFSPFTKVIQKTIGKAMSSPLGATLKALVAAPISQRIVTCDGLCSRWGWREEPGFVLCISACKDSQVANQRSKGGLMTQAFLDAMEKTPTMSLKELQQKMKSVVSFFAPSHP
ncbi:peptidase C14 [Hymenopellis radicata]|nr:peptidase C14 [Hymenopellis radicata]